MSTADIVTSYEKHLEANWTREGGKAAWGGYEVIKNAPRCTYCKGTGRIDYPDSEFTQTVYSVPCGNCRGLKCEITPEVRKWVNEDGTLNAN